MKEYYKISEISKLYNIGVDSLRYYERLGILKPQRSRNNYRMYSLKDMYILNIIKDLRLLNFSMKRIKAYIDNLDIDNTLKMLNEEYSAISCEIERLNDKKKLIESRVKKLNDFYNFSSDKILIKDLKSRYLVTISANISSDEEMDIVVKKLHRKHEKKFLDLGNQTIGAFISLKDTLKKGKILYNSVFLLSCSDIFNYDYKLLSGKYLSVTYKGSYNQLMEKINDMYNYAKINKIDLDGEPFEIYHIDNRYTIDENEFVTEIQCKIK
ncbi:MULTISPECIES: MerR family transcriptional regulator [Anaerofustis]|uniref:MerR family transcriptional regulator n=1 Tax=Anaerofustis TaxID=264995 RepID=UPI00110740BA|nr:MULTISPECIES: MerR family transcriptional regulator [Anaerofustis]MCO8193889.1 MerR family transcriptional regulator [Anaerofustis sp. NSJ-163]